MTTTRRGLLGMFAAGVAAAVLPSGVIMPVRRLALPALNASDILLPTGIGIDWGGGDSVVETWINLPAGDIQLAIPRDQWVQLSVRCDGDIERTYVNGALRRQRTIRA
jgi:hypothetical protein